jgi:Protein of unknown function (DUF642)
MRHIPIQSALTAAAAIALLSGCSGTTGSSAAPPTLSSQALQSAAVQPDANARKGRCGSQNLIQDGDFETPIIPSGTFATFATGGALGSWTVIGPPGSEVLLINNTASEFGYTYNAESGVQSIDLTVGSNYPAGLQQTVNLQANHRYTLCFWVGNINDPQFYGPPSSTVIVMVNGQQSFKATNKRGVRDSGVVTWKQFKKTFVAAGGATTISFNNGGPASDNYNGLDNVELAP